MTGTDDSNAVLIRVLEERLDGLRAWLDERFKSLASQEEQRATARAIQDRDIEIVRKKVFDDHEDRLVKLERLAWLAGGVMVFLSPVVIWAIIEIIKTLTG